MTNTAFDPKNIEQAQLAFDVARGLADTERQKIADCATAVETAERDLDAATTRFREKPSASAATSKLVAEQILENAREALTQAQDAARDVFTAEARARLVLDYARGVAEMSTYVPDIDAEVAVILEAEARIRVAIERMQARNKQMRLSFRVVDNAVGKGGLPPVPNYYVEDEHLPARVRSSLVKKYGGPQAFAYGDVKSVSQWISAQG